MNRKRYREPPTAFVDRVKEQQEEGLQDLHLKHLPDFPEEIRLSGPNERRPKVFELRLRQDIPKLVKKCQGKCGQKIGQDFFAVVRFYGESTWTDSNGHEDSKFGPLYIHFERKCLEKFEDNVCYGPTSNFDISRI